MISVLLGIGVIIDRLTVTAVFVVLTVVLAAVLTTSWSPIAGAPTEVVADVRSALGGDEEDMDDPGSALEVRCVALRSA